MQNPKTLPFEPDLNQRNLGEQCADHIVLLIASGELKFGSRLIEKELCERLGVSRVPVREALRLLHAQGVVRTEPNRGSFVSEFGSVETADLLELRISVERLALSHVQSRLERDPSILILLEKQIDDMREKAAQGDRLAYCQADLGFHERLVSLSESPVLMPAWASLSRGVLTFLVQERAMDINFAESIEEHVFLVDLIRSGRAGAADREIERHITRHVNRATLPNPRLAGVAP